EQDKKQAGKDEYHAQMAKTKGRRQKLKVKLKSESMEIGKSENTNYAFKQKIGQDKSKILYI
uniref:hypothetical protein n=1 Tax=uncultured Prevotella sp. TaxID=159272 RepID=UPI00262466BD